MGLTVCIDPGINGCGVATFAGYRLIWAKFCGQKHEGTIEQRVGHVCDDIRNEIPAPNLIGLLITELPVAYPGGKVNPNKALVPLAQIGAYLAGATPHATWLQYRPAEWKGNTKKADFTTRIASKLTFEEHQAIVPCSKSLAHNVLDACGLGLYHFGRL